jgi:hypothetical protein
MKKNIFKLSALAVILFSHEICGKEYGGKSFGFKSGVSDNVSISGGGNTNEVFDRDNPDFITSFFESKTAKENRELRKFVKQNIEHIYSEIVPKYEQSNWRKDGEEVDNNGKYGWYRWIPKGEKDNSFSITYQEVSDKKYKNISEALDAYFNKLKSNDSYKYTFNVIKQTKDAMVVEIERFERGVSDTLKKNTQIKIIEKWILNNNWNIKLSYLLMASDDKEKNDSWNNLKGTWEKRFSNVEFESETSER